MVGPAPDAAPTLVLLHEGLGCVALWRDFPEALAAATGCGVFACSRFGYGGSDPASLPRPMSYMHDEALEVLPRVLDAAGVRRAVLVGHSDGGSIAAIHAGAVHDPRVLGVVMIAAHFFVEDLNIASIRAIKATYEQGDLRAAAGALSPRRGCGVPRLERRLARSAVPRIRHHGAASRASRCRCWRCRATDDPMAPRSSFAVLERTATLPGRDAADRRRPPRAASGGEGRRRWTRSCRSCGACLMGSGGMIDFQTDPAAIATGGWRSTARWRR